MRTIFRAIKSSSHLCQHVRPAVGWRGHLLIRRLPGPQGLRQHRPRLYNRQRCLRPTRTMTPTWPRNQLPACAIFNPSAAPAHRSPFCARAWEQTTLWKNAVLYMLKALLFCFQTFHAVPPSERQKILFLSRPEIKQMYTEKHKIGF